MCVCVCVCVRERERGHAENNLREHGGKNMSSRHLGFKLKEIMASRLITIPYFLGGNWNRFAVHSVFKEKKNRYRVLLTGLV